MTEEKIRLDLGSFLFLLISILSFTFISVNALNIGLTKISLMSVVAIILIILGIVLGDYQLELKMDLARFGRIIESSCIALLGAIIVQLLGNQFSVVTSNYSILGFFVVLMATAEEFFFRGALLSVISKFSGYIVGIFVSSLIWTVFHYTVYGSNPQVLIVIFLSGLIFGFAVFHSKSLFPSIFAHSIVNLLGVLIR